MMEARIAWGFRVGPVFEAIRIRTLRAGEPPKIHKFERDIIVARPRQNDTVEDLLTTLHDLGSCRPVGMGAGRIPITAIWDHCERRRMDSATSEITTRVLLDADVFYLAEYAKKAAKK